MVVFLNKFILILSFLFFYSCSSYNTVDSSPSVEGNISDYLPWYSDVNYDLLDLNVSISFPNETGYTLDDVDSDINTTDEYEPSLHVIIQADNFRSSKENAVFKIRGNYSRTLDQKSYAIKLDSSLFLFMSQRKFQLNKHQSDRSRVQNKLVFDLLIDVPNLTSLKTQFVNLFINGEDYGLFTHVEAYREEFLVNRTWDKDDNLYNVDSFFFSKNANLAVDNFGNPIDEAAFNKVLEIKNGKDHSALTRMLELLNSDVDIDTVIAKHFSRENYLTWMALNLILSNKDTSYHNFFLYNPKGSEVFYFMPWDYDGAWASYKYLGHSEHGIAVWWESVLHRKFLSVKKNRDDLYKMADNLRKNYFTNDKMNELLNKYESVVKPFASKLPDSKNNSEKEWVKAKENLVTSMEQNIQMYKDAIGDPMSFRERITYSNGVIEIDWDESVDLEGDVIVYDVNLSNNPDLNNSILNVSTNRTSYTTNKILSKGTYYLKVTAKQENNASRYQEAFDILDVNGTLYYGIKELVVE